MSAGTHDTANTVAAKPKRRMIWIFGGAATAVVAGGLLMQYFRAPAGQAADGTEGTARVGAAPKAKQMARVGNEIISYDAVAAECVSRYGREVLDDMIHRMIITKACEDAKITVSEQEVSQEIARIAERFKLDVTAYLQMLQTERNITPMQYRTSVIWPMLALKKLAGENVEITEDDIKQAFTRGP
jgi:foldase protein PrsA